MSRFKLTREQRHEVYKAALKFYLNSPKAKWGICQAVSKCDCNVERPNMYKYPAQYPELFKHATKFLERSTYWWPLTDRTARISLLNQAIEETKPEE